MIGRWKTLFRDESGGAGIVHGLVGAIAMFAVLIIIQNIAAHFGNDLSIDGIVDAFDGLIRRGLELVGLSA